MQVGRCLIDAGYVPDTVYFAIRRSGRSPILMPSKGVGVGASSKALAGYKRRKGDLYTPISRHGGWTVSSLHRQSLERTSEQCAIGLSMPSAVQPSGRMRKDGGFVLQATYRPLGQLTTVGYVV